MPKTPDLTGPARIEKPLETDFKTAAGQDGQSEDLGDFISQLKGEIEAAAGDLNTHARKWVENYRWRRGLEGKRDKNVPFPNSSDIRYRISEMKIRQKKAGDVAVVWNAPKIVRYAAGSNNQDEAKNRLEHFGNYLYRYKIPRFCRTLAAVPDKKYECGKSVVKVTWEHKTCWKTEVFLKEDGDKLRVLIEQGKTQALQQQQEGRAPALQGQPLPKVDPKNLKASRQELIDAFSQIQKVKPGDKTKMKHVASAVDQYLAGNDTITYMREVVTAHNPAVEMVAENQSLIVPSNTSRLCDAEWICHEMFYSEREMRNESEANGGRYRHVRELFGHFDTIAATPNSNRIEIESQRAAAEGIEQPDNFEGYFKVWEIYCWIARKHISRFVGIGGDDDAPVRAVLTICPDVYPDSVPPLRLIEFPYQHYEWPFVEFNYNYQIDRYYAHDGIHAYIAGFEEEYQTSSNAAIDRNTVTLSPPIIIYDQSGITPQQFRQFGQPMFSEVPVDQALSMVQYPNLAAGMEFDAEKNLQWVDKMLGDANLGELMNRGDSPTAAEVGAQMGPANSVTYFEHMMTLDSWTQVFRQVHALCKQYWFTEQDSYTFPRTDNPSEFETITKGDFDGDWVIQAGGDPSKLDPMQEFQRWFTFAQMILQYPEFKIAAKGYDLLLAVGSRLIGYAETAGVIESRQVADQMKQAMMKLASQQVAREQMGKRPERQRKIKSVPNANAGVVPQ